MVRIKEKFNGVREFNWPGIITFFAIVIATLAAGKILYSATEHPLAAQEFKQVSQQLEDTSQRVRNLERALTGGN